MSSEINLYAMNKVTNKCVIYTFLNCETFICKTEKSEKALNFISPLWYEYKLLQILLNVIVEHVMLKKSKTAYHPSP